MKILVDIEGVLKSPNDDPITTGVVLVGTLTTHNQIFFMSPTTKEETERWLDINKIVDYDGLIDSSFALEGEELKERQVTVARSQGRVELLITNSPKLWAFAFEQGIPSIMFGVPSYTRVEFRPDAPKRLRAWDEIESAIEKQNAIRTQDARLTRTEGINFE